MGLKAASQAISRGFNCWLVTTFGRHRDKLVDAGTTQRSNGEVKKGLCPEWKMRTAVTAESRHIKESTSQRKHQFWVEFRGLFLQFLQATATPNWPKPSSDSQGFE